MQAHAVRLGVDTAHLTRQRPAPPSRRAAGPYRPDHLRDAGSLFAATWFALRGVRISWPLEPCRYDLLADHDGTVRRIQVKTTTGLGPNALALISNSRRRGRCVYAPGEINDYFVVDGELSAYLIPYEVAAGYGQLQLGHYEAFKVVDRGALLSGPSSP